MQLLAASTNIYVIQKAKTIQDHKRKNYVWHSGNNYIVNNYKHSKISKKHKVSDNSLTKMCSFHLSMQQFPCNLFVKNVFDQLCFPFFVLC